MSFRLVFLMLLGFGAAMRAVSATPELSVPIELDQIQFDGNVHFSPQQLRNALAGEADYWIANHAKSDVVALTVRIAELISRGYRDHGFRDVFVDVSPDDDGDLRCLIQEGERFHCRGIRFHHFDELDVTRLRERLTRPFPDSDAIPTIVQIDGKETVRWVSAKGEEANLNSPIFEAGRPVAFESTDKIGRAVSAALDDLGFPDAFAVVRWVPDPSNATADLLIDLVEEGTPNQIKSVTLEGLNRNFDQAVLDFLEIPEDAVFDQALRQQVHGKVWQCGRFSSTQLRFDKERGEMTIELEEIPAVPTIDQPLGEVGETLLRAREWIANHARNQVDIELAFEWNPHWTFRLTYATGGVVMEAIRTPVNAEESLSPESKILVRADNESMVLVHADMSQCLRLRTENLDGQIRFSTDLSAAEEGDRLYRFFFNGNVRSDRPSDQSPFVHRWLATPSGWLALMSKKHFRSRLDEGQLVIWDSEKPDGQIKIDRETGAIESVGGPVQIRFSSGLYEAASARVTEAVRDKQDTYQMEKPFSSLVSYSLSPSMVRSIHSIIAPDASWDHEQLAVVKKLVDNGLLSIPDAVAWSVMKGSDDESFSIPLKYDKVRPPKQMMIDVVARLVLKYSSAILPKDGWPVEVSREACLIAMGRTEFSQQVMEELLANPEVGPVGHAAIAYLMQFVGKGFQQKFARRGLDQLNAAAFQKDYEMLVAISGQSLLRETLSSLDSLSEHEMHTLLRSIPDLRLQAFLAYVHANRSEGRPSESAALFWVCQSPLNSFLSSMTR